MLKKKAVFYYNNGYSCSQSIIKAGCELYNINITNEMLNMCSAINMGLGIGTTCSVILGAVMLFGILFDVETAKALRIQLISEFHSKFGHLDCCKLKSKNCEAIIANVADIVEELVSKTL